MPQKFFFFSGAGALEVYGREYSGLGEIAVKYNLGVAGALEFLEYEFIHFATGINEYGGDDSKATLAASLLSPSDVCSTI